MILVTIFIIIINDRKKVTLKEISVRLQNIRNAHINLIPQNLENRQDRIRKTTSTTTTNDDNNNDNKSYEKNIKLMYMCYVCMHSHTQF